MGGSPLFQGAQTWPGGVATSQVSGMSAPALPAAGGARGMDPFLASLLAKKQQQADEDRALQKQLQYRQLAALDSAKNQASERSPAPVQRRAQFVKMQEGLGRVAGYQSAPEGTPGAAFAGYALNSEPGGPNNAGFAPGAAETPGSLTPLDLNESEAQRRALEHAAAMRGGGRGGTPAQQRAADGDNGGPVTSSILTPAGASAQYRALSGMR